jgi:alginate O-acetyltransferase complex protein AlgI
LVVVVAVHHSPLGWTMRKVALLLFSYLFYAAWTPLFVLLLWGSTVIDWFVAQGIARSQDRRRRRLLLAASLVFNLGVLAGFKYTGFLLESGAGLLHVVGVDWHPGKLNIILPIGISFYTFMTISYVLDVYRGRALPARNFLDYALYVTFFPHLVSGPIVRATELVPQFESPRRATGPQLGWGAFLIVLGLFEKVVVADGLLAPAVEKTYASALKVISTADAWVGTVAFAGQIFCDFAGYTTCAIGVSLCLGFALPDNFRFPYAAVGFSDFWRRWHISLSAWLRDYVYIGLGGNRRGSTHVNLLLTMLIGGLWHGASWTFVAWGGLHGTYLVVERVLQTRVPSSSLWRTTGARLCFAAVTFALVCVAWVFFRATSFEQAFRIVAAMFGGGVDKSVLRRVDVLITLASMGLLLGAHWFMRDTTIERVVERTPWPLRSLAIAVMLLALVLFPGEDRAFIYFQF